MGIRGAITAKERNADIVRQYLRVFETFAVDELTGLVAPNVIVHEGGTTVRGLGWVRAAVRTPGLAACRISIDDLFAARDRVMVACTVTYTRAETGQQLTLTGLKSYRLRDGLIVELWGATDVFGFLRRSGLVQQQQVRQQQEEQQQACSASA
jgi:ketosteroid isomerase-like protein